MSRKLPETTKATARGGEWPWRHALRERSLIAELRSSLDLSRITLELMDHRQQKSLLIDPGARARVWCRTCGRELTDPVSRSRRLGAECDPEPRNGYDQHDVDQDPIPGL